MGRYNESVIEFLEKDDSGLLEYFKECEMENKKPNYSEFQRKYLNGTTSEGVYFDSIELKREELTLFLRNKYKLWLLIK